MTDITAIIPSYNSIDTIEAAVGSALAQTIPVNVIVVDDGSKDATVSKVQQLAKQHANLKLIVQPQNGGPSAARNRAISEVKTSWVAVLDADDYMHPDRLRKMVDVGVMEQLDLVADDLVRVPATPHPANGTRLWADDPFGLIRMDTSSFALENLNARTGSRRELGYLKPIIRSEFLFAHNIRYNEDMRLSEDYDIYMRCLLAGARFGLTDPCGYFSVDYPNSLSKEFAAADLRRVLDRDREYLKHPGITLEARQSITQHMMQAYKHWAWMHLIERVRSRDLAGALATFAAPPQVGLTLLARVFRHSLGKEPVSHTDDREARVQSIEKILAIS
tara:strand:- start:21416 stop:22414 length:999 start_codon:yes stop_codon:yes gene_type:complete